MKAIQELKYRISSATTLAKLALSKAKASAEPLSSFAPKSLSHIDACDLRKLP